MFGIEMIEKYVEDKICDYGADVIMNLVAASPVGFAFSAMNRISDFIETDGVSELDRIATGEIRQLTQPLRFKFKGQALLKKMQDVFLYPTSQHRKVWERGDWATSRQDWLTNAWRHDWRSQPRNQIGEWIPGRLPYPVITARMIGKGKARSSRQRRRINRYWRYGRIAARSAMRGSDGN